MRKYWQSLSYKVLEQEWYAKLKESGFVDHEKIVADEKVLIQSATNAYRDVRVSSTDSYSNHSGVTAVANVTHSHRYSNSLKSNEYVRENKSDYYSLIMFYTENEKFTAEVDHVVMLRHAAGFRIQDICRELSFRGYPRHRQTVRFIIRHYENKWGVRKWTPIQLNPPWRTGAKKPPTR